MGNLLPTVRRFMVHEKWDDALFVHYRVDAEKLQQLLPEGLEVDLYGDEKSAWIGVVALTECGIIPTLLFPSWLLSFPLVRSLVAMTHHAVNVRTYVRPATTGPTTSSGDDEGQKQQQRERGEPGIYFFNLDCSTIPPAAGASIFFNLRYQYARMERSWRGQQQQMEDNSNKNDGSNSKDNDNGSHIRNRYKHKASTLLDAKESPPSLLRVFDSTRQRNLFGTFYSRTASAPYLRAEWTPIEDNNQNNQNDSTNDCTNSSTLNDFDEGTVVNNESSLQSPSCSSFEHFLVERYCLYNEPGPVLKLLGWLQKLFKPSALLEKQQIRGKWMWKGSITHEPWPLKQAHLSTWECSVFQGLRNGDFLRTLINQNDNSSGCTNQIVAHCSPNGVGPINFYWEGRM